MGAWTLRRHLAALLMATLVLTLALAGSAVLLYRIPRIEHESQEALLHEVREVGARMELLLGTRQAQLALLHGLLAVTPAQDADALLDAGVRDGELLRAAYRVSPRGRVLAAGLVPALRAQRAELLGSDLSASRLFRALDGQPGSAWDGRYLSVLSGQITAGVAYRADTGDTLIAEVPVEALLDAVDVAAGANASAIWVVDQRGEVIADTGRGHDVGRVNISSWPLMQAVQQGADGSRVFDFQDGRYRVATAHSPALGWYFVGHAHVGLANPEVRALVLAVAATFIASLAIGLLMAPLWASYLGRPLQTIVARAARTMRGHAGSAGQTTGPVAEFNRLSHHLTRMAAAMRERELKFLAIFNASPVPTAVTDADGAHRLLDVNEAWCQALGFRREEAIGRTGTALRLFSEAERAERVRHMQGDSFIGDAVLRRADGSSLHTQTFGQRIQVGSERWLVWASIDTGPVRLATQQLRALNQRLEDRVRQRSAALADANAALSQTVEQLRTAQHELVRSEKMAALGSLVAGVAHELNTPLGNGVMAVSAMADTTRSLRAAMQAGLRRSDLQQMLESLEQGTDIAGRNLRRAADLVQSFKQVAVDQTSAQRRSFELGEVVHEMVVSLKPSFARQPWRIEVDVPASGLRLDSYPGALGQVLGNLIQNAVLHGFEGRAQGTVRISAGRVDAQQLWLRVADDGRGIAAQHIGRVFEPFMTTKMGRGGTGLGLHISYNAVANLLGGTLTVRSGEGEGACFEIRVPVLAPRDTASEDGRGGAGHRERQT